MYLCLVVMHSVLKKRYLISKSNDNRRERALKNLFVMKPDPSIQTYKETYENTHVEKHTKYDFVNQMYFSGEENNPRF